MLPQGFDWADWSGRSDTIAVWESLPTKVKQRIRTRLMQIDAGLKAGRRLPKEQYYVDRGIGKAKTKSPNPGHRTFEFQDGETRYITHIVPKDDDHDEQINTAIRAREEHMQRKRHERTNRP